jgi:ABC-2 type transport system permease protein
MVELQKKYQVGKRRFGLINWVGTYSLFKKEILRFLTVAGQTLFGPILTSILFLTVISLAIGDQRNDVLGVSYIKFLASGSTKFCTFKFIFNDGKNDGYNY